MPSRNVASYTLGFAAIVCVVCAVLVSSAAVALRDRQELNAELERRRNVLKAAGVMGEDERLTTAEVERRFADFEAVALDLTTGVPDPAFVIEGYDARRVLADPTASRPAPPNDAQLTRIPNHVIVYQKQDAQGQLEMIVLPIMGKGLWSTMFGFLALGPDLSTVRGLAYYQHGETPGLGGEVDNPRWKALWPDRQVFDADGTVRIEVIRGNAAAPDQDPYRVDGLSGATLTSRGVTAMLRFWLGPNGYGPYLDRLRKETADGSTT